MRPNLTSEISIESFKQFYWLKEELQTYCKEQGMSGAGSKLELADRILTYLQTGEKKKPIKKTQGKKIKESYARIDLCLDTVISENHRCSQEVRAFFNSVIPKFHFSTYIQNYFKQNIGKTYRDVVNAWYEEVERKKDPSFKKSIAPQFEYNLFIRDFFLDPNNKGKSRKDAIQAWKQIKALPGSNKYEPTN